jgi:lysophospholipase L1-like esterase
MFRSRPVFRFCAVVCASVSAAVIARGAGAPRLPRLAVTRFVAFGDSLTKGVLELSVPVPRDATYDYPSQLAAMLARRYAGQPITVVNAGHALERTHRGLARLPQVLDAERPEALLLLEGTNDLVDGDAGIRQSIDEVRQMIDLASARGVRTLVATLPPQRPGARRAEDAALVPIYNAQLERAARQHAWHVVPVYRAFDPNELSMLLGPDGLHPSVNGYLRIAEAFFDDIHTTFEIRTRAYPR